MWVTIQNYVCDSPGCRYSSLSALALTETDETPKVSCTPRCPGCAQLTRLVSTKHEEVRLDEVLAKQGED